MKANWILFLCYILLPWSDVYGQNVGFYREYWATFDRNVSNSGSRWRVNDDQLSLHHNFGKRPEARANGLVLLSVPEALNNNQVLGDKVIISLDFDKKYDHAVKSVDFYEGI